MPFLILPFVFLVLLGLAVLRAARKETVPDWLGGGILAFGIFSVVSLLLFFVPIPCRGDRSELPTSERQLRALRLYDSVEGVRGSFFLGCGSVGGGGGEKRFWWYERGLDGGCSLMEAPVWRARVFEDCFGDQKPFIRRIHSENRWSFWLGYKEYLPPQRRIEFHVPENSILEEFQLQ